jgi:tetratricopeptide (TPR) repeat protein
MIKVISQEEEKQRDQAEAMIREANELKKSGQFQDAMERCSRVLKTYPSHFGALITRGNVYRGMGKKLEAIADYKEAIRITQGMPGVSANIAASYLNLAAVHEEMDKPELAEETYRQLLRRIPPDRSADIQAIKELIGGLKKKTAAKTAGISPSAPGEKKWWKFWT